SSVIVYGLYVRCQRRATSYWLPSYSKACRGLLARGILGALSGSFASEGDSAMRRIVQSVNHSDTRNVSTVSSVPFFFKVMYAAGASSPDVLAPLVTGSCLASSLPFSVYRLELSKYFSTAMSNGRSACLMTPPFLSSDAGTATSTSCLGSVV